MYYITGIKWIGYEEADLDLYDGKYHVRCFSHPCHNEIGDTLDEVLFCVFTESVIKIDEKYEVIQNDVENILCGKVIDKREKIFKIGAFAFQLETLPNDIYNEDFIKVVCSRVSI